MFFRHLSFFYMTFFAGAIALQAEVRKYALDFDSLSTQVMGNMSLDKQYYQGREAAFLASSIGNELLWVDPPTDFPYQGLLRADHIPFPSLKNAAFKGTYQLQALVKRDLFTSFGNLYAKQQEVTSLQKRLLALQAAFIAAQEELAAERISAGQVEELDVAINEQILTLSDKDALLKNVLASLRSQLNLPAESYLSLAPGAYFNQPVTSPIPALLPLEEITKKTLENSAEISIIRDVAYFQQHESTIPRDDDVIIYTGNVLVFTGLSILDIVETNIEWRELLNFSPARMTDLFTIKAKSQLRAKYTLLSAKRAEAARGLVKMKSLAANRDKMKKKFQEKSVDALTYWMAEADYEEWAGEFLSKRILFYTLAHDARALCRCNVFQP